MPLNQQKRTSSAISKYTEYLLQHGHAYQHVSDSHHYKHREVLEIDNDMGKNRTELIELHNGLLTSRTQFRMKRDVKRQFSYLNNNPGFMIIIKGWSIIHSEQHQFKARLQPGDIIYRNGDCQSQYTCINPKEIETHVVSIDLSADLIEQWLAETKHSISLSQYFKAISHAVTKLKVHSNKVFTIAEAILNIDVSTLRGQLEYESQILTLLNTLFCPLNGVKINENVDRTMHLRITQASKILDHEWRMPPTIAELAKRVGTNECYLKAEFKRTHDMTIGRYIRKQKMQRANKLLQSGLYTVQEVAYEVGFNNASHFANLFKREFGLSPSAFRQS